MEKILLSAVSHYQKSVTQLILVLGADISKPIVEDDDVAIVDNGETPKKKARRKQSDLRAALKSKKNAFVRAKDIVIEIQDIWNSYEDSPDIKWLISAVEDLCSAGELAISEMLGNMDLEIPIDDLGGTETNAAIDLRGESVVDIKEIASGVNFLRDQLKGVSSKSRTIIKNVGDGLGGVVEEKTLN